MIWFGCVILTRLRLVCGHPVGGAHLPHLSVRSAVLDFVVVVWYLVWRLCADSTLQICEWGVQRAPVSLGCLA